MASREGWCQTLAEDTDKQTSVKERAVAWSSVNGLVMRTPQGDFRPAPITLVPFPFPRDLFDQAFSLCKLYNDLYMRVGEDYDWLCSVLKTTVETDEFTRKLLEIYTTVRNEGVKKQVKLMINRSDYMIHQPDKSSPPALRQVEMNTIAASFASLSQKTGELHKFLNGFSGNGIIPEESLPANNTLRNLPNAIATAFNAINIPNSIVVFLVQPGEKNSIDQEWLQTKIWENHNIRSQRLTLNEIETRTFFDEKTRALTFEGVEISVVYMRAGYAPSDYPSQIEWEGRLRLERCRAVLCPDIGSHLAGAKKVQQELARENALLRFCDEGSAKAISSSFAELCGFEPHEANKTAQIALASPHSFVLKPQREGGGNNLYDDELVQEIQSHVSKNNLSPLQAFVLMGKIVPPTAKTVICRDYKITVGEALCELGVFGLVVRNGDSEILNESGGYLVRSKLTAVKDGGVAAGNAVLDSLCLV